MMGLLFGLLPLVAGSGEGNGFLLAGGIIAGVLIKIVIFTLFCYIFARYVEKPLARFIERMESLPDYLLTVTGIALVVAALAGMLGFSEALGAFFAGLAFSRDPQSIKGRRSFQMIYEFFTPFFFIGIGLAVSWSKINIPLIMTLFLAFIAILGKVGGTALPLLRWYTGSNAMVMGVSMIPRAEITMIIMQQALRASPPVVSGELYSAMVGVVMVTCLVGPVWTRRLLNNAGTSND
jgi:Kef-type K+ transport system membrane component KefB